MKTLAKPLAKLDVEISFKRPYQQSSLKSNSFQQRKFHSKWKFLLITLSFFTFIAFSESPEIDAQICQKFNNEQACIIW